MKVKDLKLTFSHNPSSSRSRHFNNLITVKKRWNYLLENEVTAKRWATLSTFKEFWRPQLNGITVIDRENNPDSKFNTPEEAITEGKRIRAMIVEYLEKLKEAENV